MGARAEHGDGSPAWPSAAGFIILAGLGMGLLAAVVLLPAYGKLLNARYELACAQSSIGVADRLIAANDRLIAALPEDEVLTKRLALGRKDLAVAGEMAVPCGQDSLLPATIHLPQTAPPARPGGIVMHLANRLGQPPVRRGLFVLAAVTLMAAFGLFGTARNEE